MPFIDFKVRIKRYHDTAETYNDTYTELFSAQRQYPSSYLNQPDGADFFK